jgi:hypothetical protein
MKEAAYSSEMPVPPTTLHGAKTQKKNDPHCPKPYGHNMFRRRRIIHIVQNLKVRTCSEEEE